MDKENHQNETQNLIEVRKQSQLEYLVKILELGEAIDDESRFNLLRPINTGAQGRGNSSNEQFINQKRDKIQNQLDEVKNVEEKLAKDEQERWRLQKVLKTKKQNKNRDVKQLHESKRIPKERAKNKVELEISRMTDKLNKIYTSILELKEKQGEMEDIDVKQQNKMLEGLTNDLEFTKMYMFHQQLTKLVKHVNAQGDSNDHNFSKKRSENLIRKEARSLAFHVAGYTIRNIRFRYVLEYFQDKGFNWNDYKQVKNDTDEEQKRKNDAMESWMKENLKDYEKEMFTDVKNWLKDETFDYDNQMSGDTIYVDDISTSNKYYETKCTDVKFVLKKVLDNDSRGLQQTEVLTLLAFINSKEEYDVPFSLLLKCLPKMMELNAAQSDKLYELASDDVCLIENAELRKTELPNNSAQGYIKLDEKLGKKLKDALAKHQDIFESIKEEKGELTEILNELLKKQNDTQEQNPNTQEQDPEEYCGICHDELSNRNKETIECGHSFHQICIRKYLDYQAQNKKPMNCPICRATINKPLVSIQEDGKEYGKDYCEFIEGGADDAVDDSSTPTSSDVEEALDIEGMEI